MKRAKKLTESLDDPFMVVKTGTPRQMQAYIEDRGINPNKCRTGSGWTLLHRAAELGQTEICQVLVHFGAKINERTSQGWYTPLHLALGSGWYDTAIYLLDAGADASIRNKYGMDTCAYAVKKGFEDISKRFYLAAKVKNRERKLMLVGGGMRRDERAESALSEEYDEFDEVD